MGSTGAGTRVPQPLSCPVLPQVSRRADGQHLARAGGSGSRASPVLSEMAKPGLRASSRLLGEVLSVSANAALPRFLAGNSLACFVPQPSTSAHARPAPADSGCGRAGPAIDGRGGVLSFLECDSRERNGGLGLMSALRGLMWPFDRKKKNCAFSQILTHGRVPVVLRSPPPFLIPRENRVFGGRSARRRTGPPDCFRHSARTDRAAPGHPRDYTRCHPGLPSSHLRPAGRTSGPGTGSPRGAPTLPSPNEAP